MNTHHTSAFTVRLAQTPEDLRAAQRLRYEVFVAELGAGGAMVDHAARLERDAFDEIVDHLLLTDDASGDVVGVYRLLRSDALPPGGQFYSETEYDLTPLRRSGRRLLELGRSCLHRDYRGGVALHRLWSGLADYIDRHRIEILFGVASFHGTDVASRAAPLSLLHHRHPAPQALRVRALPPGYQRMDLMAEDQIDRTRAMQQVPSLIKAYLRLGSGVGEGAFVDHVFNTVDVCLVLEIAQMHSRQRRGYGVRGSDG